MSELPYWTEVGTAEFDALLEAMETAPETPTLMIPCSPTVVRWLIRGEFVRPDGIRAHVIGGHVRGRELELLFRETAE